MDGWMDCDDINVTCSFVGKKPHLHAATKLLTHLPSMVLCER